jgi:hypothetical protein
LVTKRSPIQEPPMPAPTNDHLHRAAQLAAWQRLWKRLLVPPVDPPAPGDDDEAAIERRQDGCAE